MRLAAGNIVAVEAITEVEEVIVGTRHLAAGLFLVGAHVGIVPVAEVVTREAQKLVAWRKPSMALKEWFQGTAKAAAFETAQSAVWKSARSAISWRLSPTLITPSVSASVRRLVEEVELPTLVLLKSFRERLVEAGSCSSYHPRAVTQPLRPMASMS